jgi:cytochrome c oxidase assembly factor CtaG/putative copper export protein
MSTEATTATTSAPSAEPARPAARRDGWAVAVTAALAATAVLVLALKVGGGIEAGRIPGLPDPGTLTRWALPFVRTIVDLAGALTVGATVTAAFLLPGDGAGVSAPGWRLLRRASWMAAAWAVATMVFLILTVSDLLGQPAAGLSASAVSSFAISVSQGQALIIQAALALAVAVAGRTAMSRAGAAVAALLAVTAVLPPAFTGHAAGAGNHQVAVTSLAMHVLSAALWLGGLAALVTLRRTSVLAAVAARYSRLALVCFVGVAVSGVANAWVRLGTPDQLWRSTYGLLVLGKLAALLILGTFGATHRRRTLPRLQAGSSGAFRRLAGGELVVFAATVGLAVALSRSPTPVPTNPVDSNPVTDLLGFPMPAAPTVARMIGDVLPDMFFLTACVAGIGCYLAGVWRLRRAGHRWPPARTASWVIGMLLLAAVTDLGIARYAYVLFSAHMAQHMVLSMAVPILLVCGAPITLALRALRRPADREVRGAREWLLILVHSRVLRMLTHPVVALGIYVVGLYALYFSDLLATLMRYHLGHLAMLTHFVASGYLFYWVLIGVDPGRRRFAPPVLVLVHFTAMAFHAFFGVALMQTRTVLSASWYTAVHPPWAGSLLGDQHLGAAIAWAFGEIPAAIVFVILVAQWIRADEREQRRLDRAADRAEADGSDDALAAYNAFLARANSAGDGR